MAFKILNNIVLHNDSSAIVDELRLGDINDQPTVSDAVLIHDGAGNVTLQNVTIPQVDLEFVTTIAQLESYADQAEVDAIATSNAYTDAREVAIIATSNAYTDAREVAITASYEAYADQAEADANAYTDTQISAGTSTLDTDDIAEASNLYYTDSRVANYI